MQQMNRPHPILFFRDSLKSDAYYADEIINIYLLRPIAAGIVWILYPTRVTPNHVTILAILLGCSAAYTYTLATPAAIAVAGLLVMAKDIFDDADGQLARAKELYSRRGRFLDSIGDFVVDVAIFAAMTWLVAQSHTMVPTVLLGIAGLFGITLRVSYHVFYQASFLHLEDRYKLNRISEQITEEDRMGDPIAYWLQQVFVLIYGWQDTLMYGIDAWCRGRNVGEVQRKRWFSDKPGLRISGFLGFGTELALLTTWSLINDVHLYLLLNVFLMNGVWLTAILYRKFVLARQLAG